MQDKQPQAHFDDTLTAVEIERLTLRDRDVALEARRWTAGERGAAVDDPDALAAADLSEFITEVVKIGAHALSATGQAQESRILEQDAEGGRRASEVVARAANDAKKAITEADAASRKEFTDSVSTAKTDLTAEVRRIFAGENPELLERLQPVLDKFSTDLDAKVKAGTSELLAKAAKQFDPSDLTSPMAKHAAELDARQQKLTEQIDKNHADVLNEVDELMTSLKVQEARARLAKVTPIKGDTFENQVNAVLSEVATGLGDDFADTRVIVGAVPRSKKGDALLTIDGGAARVVIEMTDSARVGWTAYFDEAERNRVAAAALGLVRTAEQNGGRSIRVLGPRRIVLASIREQTTRNWCAPSSCCFARLRWQRPHEGAHDGSPPPKRKSPKPSRSSIRLTT